jgi:O-antigen biosynthesis protein
MVSTIRETFATLGRSVRISSERLLLDQSLAEHAAELGRLRESLAACGDELAGLRERHAGEISTLRQALTTRSDELANVKQRLSEGTSEINALREAITTRDDELIGVKQQLSEKTNEITALRQALAVQSEEFINHNALILASHSWRVTRPLRFVGRLLRGE